MVMPVLVTYSCGRGKLEKILEWGLCAFCMELWMLIWLVLCMLGFASLLGAGAVANAAHAGGLVMGLILGFGAGLIHKLGKG